MNIFTRFALLFFAIIVFCHPLLAETATGASVNYSAHTSSGLVHEIFKKSNSQLNLNSKCIALSIYEHQDEDQQLSTERDVAKKKRKYKRIFSSSATLRQPVKEIVVSLPLNGTEFYTTPHFISHLHRFLFRLTPF